MNQLLTGSLLLLTLTGCFYQATNSNDWAVAGELCQANGGVDRVEAFWSNAEDVICNNGATFTHIHTRGLTQ